MLGYIEEYTYCVSTGDISTYGPGSTSVSNTLRDKTTGWVDKEHIEFVSRFRIPTFSRGHVFWARESIKTSCNAQRFSRTPQCQIKLKHYLQMFFELRNN